MSKIHVLTVVGARPQFVKAAVVSHSFQTAGAVRETCVHTGQHYDTNMSDIFFSDLGIPTPHHHLEIGSGTHGSQTGRMLEAIERVIISESPDWVLVYGDTNSTLAGALAAAKLNVPSVHVEAGLRSFNRKMPEEVNRVLTDHLADLLMAPTETAVNNLAAEGIAADRVHLVGDVMYDVALRFAEIAETSSKIFDHLDVCRGEFVLTTIHRAENTDDTGRLTAIFQALELVAQQMPVVMPLHPRTRHTAESYGLLERDIPNLTIIEPVGYLDMIMLQKAAAVIATDSGGMQKEAYFFRVPCVTIREETEWVELIDAGVNRLCPPSSADEIAANIRSAAESGFSTAAPPDLYGSGTAAAQIADILAGVVSAC